MKKQLTCIIILLSAGTASAMLTTFVRGGVKSLAVLQMQCARACLSSEDRVEREAWEMSLLWPLHTKLVTYEEEKALLDASLLSLESIHKGLFADTHIIKGPLVNPAGKEHTVVYTFCLTSNQQLYETRDAAMYKRLRKWHLDARDNQETTIGKTVEEIKRMKAIIQNIKAQEAGEPRVQTDN